MDNDNVTIERLGEYHEEDAEDIGRLMPLLSRRFSGDPIPKETLEAIIESPHHEQLVARMNARVVGAATLSILFGVGVGREGYLQDFVVDPEVRGKGVSDALWREIINWCGEQAVDLAFTSNPSKEAAHRFYAKKGAAIRDTTVFRVVVASIDDSSEGSLAES